MNDSILSAIEKKNIFYRFFHSKIAIGATILLVGSGIFWWTRGEENQAVATDEPEIYTVAKADLVTSIEADGKVVAEDGVSLSFPSSGNETLTVEDVYVKEGDYVTKGQKIAKMDTTELEMSLASAINSLESAKINLAVKLAGPTDSEVALSKKSVQQAEDKLNQALQDNAYSLRSAELSVENAEISLENAKNSVENNSDSSSTSLGQTLESAVLTIKSSIPNVRDVIADAEDVFEENLNYDFERYLGAMDHEAKENAEDQLAIIQDLLEKFDEKFDSLTINSDQETIENALAETIDLMEATELFLDYAETTLDGTLANGSLSQSEIDSLRSSVVSQNSQIKSNKSSLISAQQKIDSELLSSDSTTDSNSTSLASAEKSLESAKLQLASTQQSNAASEKSARLSLEIAEMNLAQLLEPEREIDLASSRKSIESAQIAIDKIEYNIDQATIISPIDGKITELNGKAGDILVVEDLTSFVTILNQDSFYISSAVEEMDIAKIEIGQKVVATFDALDELELEGTVSFISSTSEESGGIVTYEVRSSFENLQASGVREGMTAFVDFITGEALDVVAIPSNAVKKDGDKTVVQMLDESWRDVETGFDTDKMVEIISGLEVGEQIIENSTLSNQPAAVGEIPEGSAPMGMSTEDLEKLRSMTEEERQAYMEEHGIEGGGFGRPPGG